MALKLQFLIAPLWLAHPVLQLIVAGIMYQRKIHRRFPVFWGYLLLQVITTPIVFYLYKRDFYASYFYLYWGTAAVCQVLGFKVIHEIFLDIFKPYHTLKDLGSVLFKWAALVMLLVAGVIATSAGPDQDFMVSAILTVQRCVRIMQCGLIIFLVLFANYLKVSYKQHSFGIAAGFGIFAAVELFIAAWIVAGHGPAGTGLVNLAGYNCAIFIWLGYVLLKKQPKEAPENLLVPQRWDQSLMDLQHPLPAESLIPMFESMVEQAFSRLQETPENGSTSAEPEAAGQPEKSEESRELAKSAAAGNPPWRV
jgi:hypothetical protein